MTINLLNTLKPNSHISYHPVFSGSYSARPDCKNQCDEVFLSFKSGEKDKEEIEESKAEEKSSEEESETSKESKESKKSEEEATDISEETPSEKRKHLIKQILTSAKNKAVNTVVGIKETAENIGAGIDVVMPIATSLASGKVTPS